MSNYPPGVTGHEPQIVGYDEEEIELYVTCPQVRHGHFEGMGDWDVDCDFAGYVLGTRYAISPYESIFAWHCETCHSDNETSETHDPEADAQEARDERERDGW